MADRKAFLKDTAVEELTDEFSRLAADAEVGFITIVVDEHGVSVLSSNPDRVQLAAIMTSTAAAELDLTGTEMPETLEARPDLLARLERLRRHGSVAMGIAADLDAAAAIVSIPKIAIVSAPQSCSALSGQRIGEEEMARVTVTLPPVWTEPTASNRRWWLLGPIVGLLALIAWCAKKGGLLTGST